MRGCSMSGGRHTEGHEKYEVEGILSHRRRRGKTQYLVKWKGYGDLENTWQTEQDLQKAQELLQEYKASRRDSS